MDEDKSSISIDEHIKNYSIYPLNEKLDLLRKLSRTIPYNDDYLIKVCSCKFLSTILNDIYKYIRINENMNSNNKEEEKDLLTYVRIFFMFFHNELGNESKYQLEIFKEIMIDNYDNFNYILLIYIKDCKIQKFFLGIIYKLYFLNTKILTDYLSYKHFDLFNLLVQNIDYKKCFSNEEESFPEIKDYKEINDWLHIIFQYIIKNDEICQKLDSKSFFNYLINASCNGEKRYIIFIEIIRDVIDYEKDSKILLISTKNISILNEELITITSVINDNINKSDLIKTYSNYTIDNETINCTNKIFICLVDIFSVLLTTDDLNDQDYRDVIFKKYCKKEEIENLFSLLEKTDSLYDDVFMRNKALKLQEKLNVPELCENNVFYGFQTNVMKFISNFSYKNEMLKNYFIENPKYFYYLLNHIKIDKCNPLKKEWTVLLIKSLCENCIKIQNLIKELNPIDMDPLLKDYIINKGTQKINFANNKEKELYFSLLNKK